MSCYKHKIDFINRTQEILRMYEPNSRHKKTLFINCCLGLLVAPQQWGDHSGLDVAVNELVNYEEWGINQDNIKENRPKHSTLSRMSVENIAYHIRNSICHCRFDLLDCNKGEVIKQIHIIDKKFIHGKEVTSFDLTMSFDDLRKFVLKYTDVVKERLYKCD